MARAEAPKESVPMPAELAVCDVCGGPTFEVHCKIICRTCGYTRDCGDP